MKTSNILSVLLITTLFVGCKENESKKEALTDEVLEQATIDVVPRASDVSFGKALKAYENNNKSEAATYINQGLEAIEKEGKAESGLYKVNLDLAKDELRNIAGKLGDNFDVSIQGFREAIANAEINVAHNYLATEDLYVLTPKDKIKESNLHKTFEHNLKSLEAGTEKLEGKAKKDGEKLKAEAKKLKAEYEAWKKRVEEHNKKTEAHFKEHQPENLYPYGI